MKFLFRFRSVKDRLLTFGMLSLTMLLSHAQAEAPDKKLNLLVNPQMENNMEGWKADTFAQKGVISLDPNEMKEGKPTLKMFNSGGDDTKLSQKVTVKPATRYRLSAFVKTKDVLPVAGAARPEGACLMILGGFEKSEVQTKTKAWRTVMLEFDTGPKTEIEVGPRLGFFGSLVTGTAWFAELSLTELGPARR